MASRNQRSQYNKEMAQMCSDLTQANAVKITNVPPDGHCWLHSLVAGLINALPDESTMYEAGRRIRERMADHIDQDAGAKAWLTEFLAIMVKYKDVGAYKKHLLDDHNKMWCDHGGPELVMFSATYKRVVVIIGPGGRFVHAVRADAYFVCPGIQLDNPLLIYLEGQHYQAVVPTGVAPSGPVTPVVKVTEAEQEEKKKQEDADAEIALALRKRFDQEKKDREFALSL